MKKIIAFVIIATVGVFAAACANTTTTNTANTTSNKNTATTDSNASNPMGEGDHRGNMMNGNHSQMGNQQMQRGMGMRPEMRNDGNRNENNEKKEK